MDVKVGSGAFLPERARARELARTLIALGGRLGLPVRALLTDMDQPLGNAIGNAAEVRETIDVLRGGGPADVRALTVRLGAEMLVLGGVARDRRDGARRIEAAIASGAGLELFRLGVRLQGGDPRAIDDPRRLPRARHTHLIRAARRGVVTRVDAGLLGRAATLLGAGRLRKEDRIAPGARSCCTRRSARRSRAAMRSPPSNTTTPAASGRRARWSSAPSSSAGGARAAPAGARDAGPLTICSATRF